MLRSDSVVWFEPIDVVSALFEPIDVVSALFRLDWLPFSDAAVDVWSELYATDRGRLLESDESLELVLKRLKRDTRLLFAYEHSRVLRKLSCTTSRNG